MTSNIGSRQIKDFGQGVGFGTKSREQGADEHTKSVIENALKKAFAPEFLNRVDDVVLFNTLSRENIHKIIDIELKKLTDRVTGLGYTLALTDKAKDFIADKGFDQQFGARPLARAIQKYVEDPLAEEIIKESIKEGYVISVDYDEKSEDKITVSIGDKKSLKSKESPTE